MSSTKKFAIMICGIENFEEKIIAFLQIWTNQGDRTIMDRGRRNKHIIVADVSVHGEGSQPPVRNQLIFLREKYAERSETEKYAERSETEKYVF